MCQLFDLTRFRAVCLVSIVLISSCNETPTMKSDEATRYFCGAENYQHNGAASFYDDGFGHFSAGGYQTDEMAFEGKFSCKVDSLNEYGMPITFTDVEAGAFFETSVWVKNPVGKATIVATFSGRSDYKLHTTSVNKVRDSAGWSQYFMSFGVEAPVDTLLFFVTTARETHFFDNFEILRYKKRPALEDSLANAALKIHIPDDGMAQLSEYKAKALEQKIVTADLKEFVSGFIIRDKDTIPAEIRLKGDWTDHLENGKTSYRIKIDQPYNGMTDFSIQHPQTRNFMHEWFIHELLDAEGLLSTTYDYLPVEINGVNQGIYAIEEHFDEHLLEKHNRVEGPILKMDESGFWELLANDYKSIDGTYPYFPASMIMPFKESRTEKSKSLSKEFQNASSLLYLYKNGYAHPEEILDLESTAKYYALLDLGNVNHALAWHNRRYYYNPVTAKLELIGFDMIPAILPNNPLIAEQLFAFATIPGKDESALDYFLFSNQVFRDHYTFYVKKFSAENYLDSISNLLKDQIIVREKLLGNEFPNYTLDLEPYYNKAAQMRVDIDHLDSSWNDFNARIAKNSQPKLIKPIFPELDSAFFINAVSVNAYIEKIDSAHYIVELENYHLAAVFLKGYTTKTKGDTMIAFKDMFKLDGFNGTAASVKIDLAEKPSGIYFQASNTLSELHYRKVFNWKKPEPTHPRIELSKKFATSNHLYTIRKDTLYIKKGNHILNELIYVPSTYVVIIEAGATIDFINKGGLIFNNSVTLKGTETEPISITSSDSSGQGLTILNAERVMISHTIFANQDGLNYKGWGTDGSLTVYEGTVNLDHVSVLYSEADDAVNLVRTTFSIENLMIRDAKKDGLDVDFSNGDLTASTFVNTPNDCIDSVGSHVLIKDITINNSSLEGGSAGDYNMLRIENEIKLSVPNELADSVWAYLKKRYNNERLYLREVDSTFNSKIAEDIFIDQYFDNDNFDVMKTSNGIRHRARTVLTDPSNRKNGRELIQLKVNGISTNILNRAEFKYPVKYYEEQTEMWDAHPFLGIAQRRYRQDIVDRLAGYGLDGTGLYPTIRLDQLRKRVYLYRGLDPFATLTLDHVTAHYGNDSAYFVELEMELNEINYTESDSASRAEMEEINADLKADLLKTFPSVHQDQTPKYNKAALRFNLPLADGTDAKKAKGGVSIVLWLFGGLSLLVIGGIILLSNKKK